ncbi:hypothetical protein [Clostridium beijerinckii]|uniref:hypothetical protein n=1 Tax=Clostridium beijerinckii TaxID=1520 RepID=UPI0009D250B2|nr:hypothetical protein [Clostridium beijerinckii]NRT78651.1 hypothetical protein [Clostridium beijerinckii]OOM41375.1 hypothetical protein CBEIJ_44930 [Clostridium beijerinckii]
MKDVILEIIKCIRLSIIKKSLKNQYSESEFEVNVNIKGLKLICRTKKNDIPD